MSAVMTQMRWTEQDIARALYFHTFAAKHAICVPNCYLPGNECDLLVVRRDLRMMDVEIKISRSDLKADLQKDKWYKPWDFAAHGWRRQREDERERVDHPRNIWKHYYCVPVGIWSEELLEHIPATSGVITMQDGFGRPRLYMFRRAKPNKEAQPIEQDDLVKLLMNINARMWRRP